MIANGTQPRRARLLPALAAALLAIAAARARAEDAVEQALRGLERAAGAPVSARRSPVTGLATFVAAPAGRPIAVAAARAARAGDRTLAFVDHAAAAFGLRGRRDVAVTAASGPDAVGIEHVRLQQLHDGVPVRGGELVVHLRGAGVTAANGRTLPPATVGTTLAIDAAAASATAASLLSQELGVLGADLTPPRLELLDPRFLQGGLSAPRLAWFIEARGFALRERIWVDAADGAILLHFSQLTAALQRFIYTAGGRSTLPGTQLRGEGGAPTGDADADHAYAYSGDTYAYYATQHGRDSYDGGGASLVSTVHYCEGACPYANAFWDGFQMVYGDGFAAADDVDAHELTHAVTEHSAALEYCGLSGALNESFSDIFGETVDLTNGAGTDTPAARWLMGEDVPGLGALRDMMDPGAFGDPAKVIDPDFRCATGCADYDYGGVHINSGVPNHAYALMVDGGTFNGVAVTGIGLAKAGRIQYRALTSYLTSAADFADDYAALQQSCADLVGTAGITAADCLEVTRALDAVELGEPVCPAACGDTLVALSEECDDGNLIDGDGCDSDCTRTRCGNGIATAGEACDDGNGIDGDGCDGNCTASACGNGVAAGGEACDDGNPTPADGCEPDCTLSPGCVYRTASDVPRPIPDGGTALSRIGVPLAGDVTLLRVLGLRGTHSYLGELDVTLVPPSGPEVALLSGACGAAADFDLDLADDAGSAVTCPATDGLAHRPLEPLAALAGHPAGGTWTLRIDDRVLADSGTLLGWGLLLCASAPICPSAPDPACRTAGKAMLRMRNGAGDTLLWKWIRGQATSLAELGDPRASAAYELCLYAGPNQSLFGELAVPPDAAKWAATSSGFRYRDRNGTADGVGVVIARAGTAGRARGLLRASGDNLALPPLGGLPLPLTAQLVNRSRNLCWGSTFDLPQVDVNDAAQFRASLP